MAGVMQGMRRKVQIFAVLVLLPVLVLGVLLSVHPPSAGPPGNPPDNTPPCKGTAACFSGTVTHIVDGDTLDVACTPSRRTLALCPQSWPPAPQEPWGFIVATCSVG